MRHDPQDRQRTVLANAAGEPLDRRESLAPKNTDCVRDLIAQKVKASDGRISAKRRQHAARNFRRAVAEEKAKCERLRRVFRPWIAPRGVV